MNLVGLKLILLACILENCSTTSQNVTPSKQKANPFAGEKKDIDKDKFLSMENVIKFEKWMVIN